MKIKLNHFKMFPYQFTLNFILMCIGFIVLSGGWSTLSAQYFEMMSPKFHLWADNIHIEKQIIRADGDVLIVQESQSIYANHIIINKNRKEIEAYDSVLAHFQNAFFSGDHLWFNLETSTGEIHQGTLYYAPGPLYIKGNRIIKNGADTYYADDVIVTSCDICSPDWMISGKDVHVTVDGYATLWHGLMTFKNIPVFYTPFFLFPVKTNRQSGLLFPFAEHSSRKGWLFQQPLYWVINKSMDATFYSSFMEKRGTMNGIEFRYNTGPMSKGTILFDSLIDRQTETQATEGEWGYSHDNYLRQNSDRYWFRMKLDQSISKNRRIEMDIDWVSDQDYLKTFDTGYTGFEKTRQQLFQRHSRDTDDNDENIRMNRIHLNQINKQSRIYAECRWYDDIVSRRNDTDPSSVHYLPVVRYSNTRTSIFSLPIFMDFDTLYSYEYHEKNSNQHQFFMNSGFSLPVNIIPQLIFEPSIRWKSGFTKDNTQSKTIQQKTIEAYLTSELYKIFSFGSKHARSKKYKHTVRFQSGYTYIPDDIDGKDIFSERLFDNKSNKVSWLISNALVEKRFLHHSGNSNSQDETIYKQRVLLEFSGDYDILKARDKNKCLNSTDETKIEPFSPVNVDFIWNGDNFQLDTDGKWSLYDNQWIQYHAAFDIHDQKDQSFRIEYQYTDNQNESLNTAITARVYEKLRIIVTYAHDLKSDQRIDHRLGFLYEGPCWQLDGTYYDSADTNDQGFSVMIHLDGITSWQ